jgi:hypothetical protein
MESLLVQKETFTLPPLILHPFADAGGPGKLAQSSRASLMLQGLLPAGELSREELDRSVLEGRYCEIRMLFYVGKDLRRWIAQCLEFVEREPALEARNIDFQSFAALLIRNTPNAVHEKLCRWGVGDYKAIFSRALALSSLFADIPEMRFLSEDFIRNYYAVADQLYASMMQAKSEQLHRSEFDFEIYASGEYSRMLERQWQAE